MTIDAVGRLPQLGRIATPLLHWSSKLLRFARRKPAGGLAAAFILVLVALALFAPLVTTHDPYELLPGMVKADPGTVARDGGRLLLGGDGLGRDLWSRVVYGARISLEVGFGATAIGVALGVFLGMLSAYLGGKFDLFFQRVVDAFQAMPSLILLMIVVNMVGNDVKTVTILLGMLFGPSSSRVFRSLVLSTRTNLYVDAARAIGASGFRIALRHILPNISHAIIIVAASFVGGAILMEASLSFLGLGPQPPTPTWGNLISGEGRQNIVTHPISLAAPATALCLSVLAFNFLGDALRDILDPRLRK